ncbi:Ribosomal protein L13e [Sesbania bispinosa]|nr:Ribosomal protein L13e [Sesbania bispinosa]
MVKHNNVIPNGHFRKHWQNYVKTWFNQPARKTRRRQARQKKAVKIFPRPTAGPLRPIVHGQTLKYNMKVRDGRGFSLEELKAAGIPKKLAPTIGIAVDHRRRNRSLESLQANVQRLKTYKAKLVVFPRRARKVKAGDSTPEELANATQVQGSYLPIVRERPSVELVKVTDEMKEFKAYYKLRLERTNKRHYGARLKKAAEAEKEEKKGLYVQGYSPTIHPTTSTDLSSIATFDVLSGSSAPQHSDLTMSRVIHGTMSAISWGILLPMGAITAHYLRHIQALGPAWFYAHAGIQLFAFVLGTVGPNTMNKFRKYWKSYHHFVGYSCVVLGFVNVFGGFEVMGASRSYAKLSYCLGLSTMIGVCIALEVNSWVVFGRKSKEEKMRREGLIGSSDKGSSGIHNHN